MTEGKILVSTDIGSDIDDALSLLIMLNHPDIELGGVYTVNGDVNTRAYIAKRMVDLAGKEIPVGRGESKPLGAVVGPYSYGEERALIDDSFLDKRKMSELGDYQVYYKSLRSVGIKENGLEHMVAQLSEDKKIIFSLGPLTNIAKILKKRPRCAGNIERVFVMGAKFPAGEMEHNIRHDAVAARDVLASDIPLTIIPSDVCEKYKMPFNSHKRFETRAGQYVKKMLLAFAGGKMTREYNFKSIEGIGLNTFFKEYVRMFQGDRKKISVEELIKRENFKQDFFVNFDMSSAYYETREFWQGFYQLIEDLRNSAYGYKFGKLAAEQLESLIPKEISVHDVYVPFCYLHHDSLKVERMTLGCDITGCTFIAQGKKHEVVRDLDYKQFARFLEQYLR